MAILKLSNGIQLVTDPMSNCTTVSIGIFLKIGSKYEVESENGMTHFIEHLLFKNKKCDQHDGIIEHLESVGATINAFTTKELICVYVKALPTHVRYVLTALVDMLTDFQVTDEAVEIEKKVILSEISRFRDNQYEQVQLNLLKLMLQKHPLTQEILGTEAGIRSYNKEQLISFYDKHFATNKLVCCISGAFTESEAQDAISILSSMSTVHKDEINVGELTYNRSSIVKESEAFQHVLSFGYPSMSYLSPNMTTFMTMVQLVGGGTRSMLSKQLRETEGLVYSIYMTPLSYREGGVLVVNMSTPISNDVNQLRHSFHTLMKCIYTLGVDERNLERAKQMTISKIVFGTESNQARMIELGKRVLYAPYDETFNTDPFAQHIADIEALTLDDMNRIVNEIFKEKPACSIIASNKT
ncbi:M16 family metallopeptidase [Paenibacillus sp. 481]|uniref:M16 family metallopeptidase n=1 Tax=Paenibacillus sp. 481 TaxID=2835869 RepID=UPI001E394B27|nr:pitrilysin family protein [Paenibacillus sp. 481]UHA74283.1 insulinase family protein [Paenibacillus sp. 481]